MGKFFDVLPRSRVPSEILEQVSVLTYTGVGGGGGLVLPCVVVRETKAY